MIFQSKLSQLQFRKLFKELYNTTPKEWLVKKSLTKAKKVLKKNLALHPRNINKTTKNRHKTIRFYFKLIL